MVLSVSSQKEVFYDRNLIRLSLEGEGTLSILVPKGLQRALHCYMAKLVSADGEDFFFFFLLYFTLKQLLENPENSSAPQCIQYSLDYVLINMGIA